MLRATTSRLPPLAFLLLLPAAGCGGDGDGILKQFGIVSAEDLDEGEASVSGEFDSDPFEPTHAIAQVVSFGGDEVTIAMLTEDPNMCDDWESQVIRFGAQFASIFLYSVDGEAAYDTGEYEIDGDPFVVEAEFLRVAEDDCALEYSELLTSGSVEVEVADGDVVAGSLSLSAPDGDLEGSFHTTPCDGIINFYSDAGVFCEE